MAKSLEVNNVRPLIALLKQLLTSSYQLGESATLSVPNHKLELSISLKGDSLYIDFGRNPPNIRVDSIADINTSFLSVEVDDNLIVPDLSGIPAMLTPKIKVLS